MDVELVMGKKPPRRISMNLDQQKAKALIRRALDQQKDAYAPYSGFHVAAAVLT